MGRRWGRPDISRYADRFDVPAADGGLAVTFLGVASLLVSDGTSAVLTDGFFSRPSPPRVLLRRIAPDPGRICEVLGRAGVTAVDAVVRYTPTTTTPWTLQPSPPLPGRACSAAACPPHTP